VDKIKSPAFIRYPKGAENPQFNKSLADLSCEDCEINLDYLYKRNQGAQFLIISYGQISQIAFEVYEKLNKNNNSNNIAEFVKLNKINPIDYIIPEVMNSSAENIIFIEEGIENGGVSQLIAAKLNKLNHQNSKYNKTIKIFAVNDFIKHGSNEELFEFCGLNAEKIYNNINDICAEKL
jgi:deoxyxylulose-5-phosphate synthase